MFLNIEQGLPLGLLLLKGIPLRPLGWAPTFRVMTNSDYIVVKITLMVLHFSFFLFYSFYWGDIG